MKGEKAGGFFFPLTAVQRFDASASENENGTYFGYPFALTFRGPFEITGVGLLVAEAGRGLTVLADDCSDITCMLQRKLSFTFREIRLRLGPKWLNIPLSPGQLGTKYAHQPCQTAHSS